MMTENYCDGCDNVVHQVFNEEDFYNHKVGLIKCPECGTIIKPCNECDHNNCVDCPWKSASISEAMSDEEHIHWYKENDKDVYELMKNGDLGLGYKELVEEIIDLENNIKK
jgi:hypothetical protein